MAKEANVIIKKGLVAAIILLFIGVAFAPSINANISKISIKNELIESIKKKSVEYKGDDVVNAEGILAKINSQIFYPKKSNIYFEAFLITFIRGEINYWEKTSDGYYMVYPIDVTIGGLWFDVDPYLEFWYMKVRIPPDFGSNWCFTMERFSGQLANGRIYGIALLGGIGAD